MVQLRNISIAKMKGWRGEPLEKQFARQANGGPPRPEMIVRGRLLVLDPDYPSFSIMHSVAEELLRRGTIS